MSNRCSESLFKIKTPRCSLGYSKITRFHDNKKGVIKCQLTKNRMSYMRVPGVNMTEE